MKKFQIGLCVALAGALGILWVVHQRTLAEARKNLAQLSQLQRALTELRAENENLKNQIAQIDNGGKERLSELLRLRAEVSSLRLQTNELETLRSQNEELLRERAENASCAAASLDAKSKASKTPPDVSPQDIHPKDTWNFAGYDSPDATTQSMLWAMTQTNLEAFLAGFSPTMRAKVAKELPENGLLDLAAEPNEITGFRVLKRSFIADDQMDLTIFLDGKNREDTTRFRKIDGAWKIADDEK